MISNHQVTPFTKLTHRTARLNGEVHIRSSRWNIESQRLREIGRRRLEVGGHERLNRRGTSLGKQINIKRPI
jgi:hypothetical protein